MTYRWAVKKKHRERYEQHAAPESIAANLSKATIAKVRAEAEADWLSELLDRRLAEKESGEWPGLKGDT